MLAAAERSAVTDVRGATPSAPVIGRVGEHGFGEVQIGCTSLVQVSGWANTFTAQPKDVWLTGHNNGSIGLTEYG